MAKSRPEIWISANTTWNLANFRSGLVKTMIGAGYQVTAFAPEDRYVDRIRELGAKHIHLPLRNSSTNPITELATVVRVFRRLRRARPALLLTFTPKPNIYGAMAARSIDVPVIANVAGLGRAFVHGGWLSRVSALLYRAAFSHPTKVFFQNQEDKDLFINNRLVTAHRTELLPGSGVDVQRFAPRKKVKGPFSFLFVGRLLAEKGVREYAQAARLLQGERSDFACQILGFIDRGNPTAISETELKQWQTEGILEYLGASDNVADVLASADCVVLPTYYREGCPRVLLEACSMAIPVIAADSSACRQIVTDGENGFLCRPKDAVDLARHMKRMMDLSDAQRDGMGQAGRKIILEHFDEQLVLNRYMEVIEQIIAGA
jgi:glycosyltransferase involved in cell wall biosynthesis